MPATLLTVMGSVVPKVRAVPGAVHFGLVRRFEEVAELITLHTVENHRVIVEEIIADCDGMQVEAVGDSPQYRIILTPEKTGDIRGTAERTARNINRPPVHCQYTDGIAFRVSSSDIRRPPNEGQMLMYKMAKTEITILRIKFSLNTPSHTDNSMTCDSGIDASP